MLCLIRCVYVLLLDVCVWDDFNGISTSKMMNNKVRFNQLTVLYVEIRNFYFNKLEILFETNSIFIRKQKQIVVCMWVVGVGVGVGKLGEHQNHLYP